MEDLMGGILNISANANTLQQVSLSTTAPNALECLFFCRAATEKEINNKISHSLIKAP